MPEFQTFVFLFRFFKGSACVREEELQLPVIRIGKSSGAALKIADDPTVNRLHAIIVNNSPQGPYIVDLGSRKGTFVNGQKTHQALLKSGDTLVIGETRLVLTISPRTASAASSM